MMLDLLLSSTSLRVIPMLPGCPWSGLKPPTIQFCEANLCSWIATPANTWSNLPYILIGFWLLRKGLIDKNYVSKIIGTVSIIVGMSSFAYHASFTFVGQFFDLSSLFFLAAILLVFNLRRLNTISLNNQFNVFLIISITSMIILLIFNKTGKALFAVELISALLIELHISRKQNNGIVYKDLLIALSIFIMAFVIWILDVTKIVCDPNNHFIQGHAIWHIMTSLCFPLLYRFYKQFEFNK